MNTIRKGGKALWLLIGLLALAGVCAVCGVASAVSFTDNVGEKDIICYDINVVTVIDPMDIEVSWANSENDIDIYLKDSQGYTISTSDGVTNTESIYYYLSTPGLYALIILPYEVTGVTMYTGTCNYPITKTTVTFSHSIKQGENINYDITVTKPNKPLLVRVDWDQSVDTLNIKVYDPSGDLMTADPEITSGSLTSLVGWYDLQETGKYKIKINGGVVGSASSITFTATSSYPIAIEGGGGGGGGGDDDNKSTMMIVAAVVVVVIVVLIVVIFVVMRKRKAEAPAATAAPTAAPVQQPSQPYQQPSPPPAQQYAPPPAQQYTPPPAQQYTPPPAQQYTPPPAQQYAPPPAQQYAPPPAPPPAQQYAPAPVVQARPAAPPAPQYQAPPPQQYQAPPPRQAAAAPTFCTVCGAPVSGPFCTKCGNKTQ